MTQPQRKYGFPLQMLVGFAIGAVIAVITAFILAESAGQFKYTALFRLVVGAGALGAYAGHVIGAMRHKDAGYEPFGSINQNVMMIGGLIVLLGSALVVGSVLGIMTMIKGPPPH